VCLKALGVEGAALTSWNHAMTQRVTSAPMRVMLSKVTLDLIDSKCI
jgi:hypothetical protein